LPLAGFALVVSVNTGCAKLANASNSFFELNQYKHKTFLSQTSEAIIKEFKNGAF
jgi:hypothetical protein